MKRSVKFKWMVRGAMVILVALVTAALLGAGRPTVRSPMPEKALDMWGMEHDLTTGDWTLFDFVHVAGCGYCVLNAAAYQENFADALASAGVRAFGVDVFEAQRDLIDYVKHHGIRFPILTEPDALWSALECPGLPGQSLFQGSRKVWSASETLTFRNYDRIRRSVGALRPFRPSGPLKKALNCVYEDERALVVVGDSFEPDAGRYFPGLRKAVFEVKRAREVVDDDLAAGSIYVLGSPAENAFHERLRDRTPFAVSGDRIAFADTVLTGDDVLLWYCSPNPWNPERYLVVRTGTAPSSMRYHHYDGSQDFTIARRTADGVIPVASGICRKSDGVWSISSEDVVWIPGGAQPVTDVKVCGPRGCEAPSPAGTAPFESATSGEPGRPSPVAPRVEFDWSTAGRFVALSTATDGACWAAWDRPGKGVFAGRVARDGCRSIGVSAGGESMTGASAAVDAFKATIAAESAERAWLAWCERTGNSYHIFAARLLGSDPADVWQISHRPNLDHHAPSLAVGGGHVWLAWYAWEANARRPYARTWTGSRWTPVSAIPTADGSQFAWYFSGAGIREETWFTWMQHYPDLTGIVAATATADGWSEPEVVARSGRYPSIAHDPATGETRVVWQQWERERPGNRRDVWSIVTAVNRDGRWSEPAPLPRCPDGRNETPIVCVDGSGCAWVFWAHKDRANDGATCRWQVVCEVFDGKAWRGPYIVSGPDVDARSPSAASSRAVWVGWHEGAGQNLDVRVKRIRAWNEVDGSNAGATWTTRDLTKN